MPTVGKREFPYTKAGIAEAKAYAAKTGQKLTTDPSQMPGGSKAPMSAREMARADLMDAKPPKRGKRR